MERNSKFFIKASTHPSTEAIFAAPDGLIVLVPLEDKADLARLLRPGVAQVQALVAGVTHSGDALGGCAPSPGTNCHCTPCLYCGFKVSHNFHLVKVQIVYLGGC